MHPALHSLVSKKALKKVYPPPQSPLNDTDKPTAPWENLTKYAGYCERSPLTLGDVVKIKMSDGMIVSTSFNHVLLFDRIITVYSCMAIMFELSIYPRQTLKDSLQHGKEWMFHNWQSAAVVLLVVLVIVVLAVPLMAFIRWALEVTRVGAPK